MKVGKDKLIKFVLFRENDCSALELYLEEMAQKGWMFNSISPIMRFFQFKKCESKKVKFCIDILEECSESTNLSSFNMPNYIDICESTGWKHITNIDNTTDYHYSSSYQIFISDDINTPPIQTDDTLKLEPVSKAIKQRFLASIITLVFINYLVFKDFVDLENLNWIYLFGVLFSAQCIISAIENFIWLYRAKKSLNEKEPIRYPSLKSLKIRSLFMISLDLILLDCILLLLLPYLNIDYWVYLFILNILKLPYLVIFILSIMLLIEIVRENIVPMDEINK